MNALAEKSVWMTRQISSAYCEGDASAAVKNNRNHFLAYFLSGIRHQIGLCQMCESAYVEELRAAIEANEQPEVIDKLYDSVTAMRESAERLTSMRDGGSWDSKIRVLDTVEVVDSTKKLISTLAMRNRITLKVIHEIRGLVDIDRFHFEQIIMNLYRNAEQAILACPDMSGEVSLVVHKVLDSDREQFPELVRRPYFCVTIKNGGPGISPHTFARIGNLKFTTKPKGEGSGHGLQVCAYLMEKNGGFMVAKTHKEEGTAFTLFFPKV
jgi:signal transduction histidine kinase